MASSSTTSRSWRYDVFPSFRGEDVRKAFLSHLRKEFERKLITTFIDDKIERSRPIGPELISAIRESRISIILFSKKYASSTWCLNELVEIYKCYKELDQMVIPIFYDVDPSDIRKQTGEFGKAFDESCKGKTEDLKQRWISALAEVASIAGEHSINWSDEAKMIEKISKDVLAKLITGPSDDDFGNYVGVRAHVDAIMDSKLSLESGGVRMVGIVGTSGIGKTTIARALYNKLSSRFDLRSFKSYKRTLQDRKIADDSVKLSWAKQLLSNILGQNDIEISSLDVVKQRLKHKKVLIILDDVDEVELLEALVGQPEWFGFDSRIIVVTQDRDLLKSHKINLIYDVELPSQELALEMFCRSAFRQNHPPNGFKVLASEVVKLSGKLPLGVTVLGSSLREKNKEEWRDILPGLRNGLYGKIGETLKVSYNKLDLREKDIFLFIACLFNGKEVNHIVNMLGHDVITVLRILADRSLINIRPSTKTVEMHSLLEKLGRGIACEEYPGKRRILIDANDIYDVFTDHTGTESVEAIYLNVTEIKETLSIAEKSFKGMYNLLFLKIYNDSGFKRISTPQGQIRYLPRKLRLLHWDKYPAKSLPSSFSGQYLVELIITDSKLEKLWEGSAQALGSLKKMILNRSNLEEIPDLSNAKNLEILSLRGCISLVELPSTIRNLKKLIKLLMDECSNLESFPTDVNLVSLDKLSLSGCSKLRTFPRISRNISILNLDGTAMKEEDCLCIEDLSRLTKLSWVNCPLRYMPSDFHTEHLVIFYMKYSKLEKLWEGVQPLQSLKKMDLYGSKELKVVPDLSNATNLEMLSLIGCKSLVTTLPPSIGNLKTLVKLEIERISKDVLAKPITGPSDDDFGNYVGVRAHVDAIMDKLSLESGGVRVVGIVGTSGIGKTTIARALYNKLSSRFDLRSFESYKRTLQDRKIADDSVKLSWAKQLLSNILGQNDIEISSLDVVKQRLKHKKVLIILDDVDEVELLEALVGQPEWFGFGSRIIVVTQHRDLLKSHNINQPYNVELPSRELALEMFCRSAFRQNHPPNGFEELASEFVKLYSKLPSGVTVLGSSLREKNKEEWRDILHGLRNRLHGMHCKIGEMLYIPQYCVFIHW